MRTYITPETFFNDSKKLAKKIYESGWKPDLILTLWRGGSVPGIVVDEYLKDKGYSFTSVPIAVFSYSCLNDKPNQLHYICCEEAFKLILELKNGNKKIPNVLIIDDIFDTGNTMYHVTKRIKKYGGIPKIATVYWKKDKCELDLKPDYYIKTFEKNEWIVFPHEKQYEDICEVD